MCENPDQPAGIETPRFPLPELPDGDLVNSNLSRQPERPPEPYQLSEKELKLLEGDEPSGN